MIHIICENCGFSYRVTEKYSGRKARCGQCGHMNSVPEVYRLSIDSMTPIPRAEDGKRLDLNALFFMLLKQENQTRRMELAFQ